MNETRVVTVSASAAGAGKTTLIEWVLPFFENCAAVKAHVAEDGGAGVIAESDPEASPGKDTSRYLKAGARQAFLIHGALPEALDSVREIIDSGEFAVVLVESNAVARELDADLAFFVEATGDEKPGADVCRRRADIVVRAQSNREERR
jgi:molybdopterin-guanine dinucleotide biosynthesis protein